MKTLHKTLIITSVAGVLAVSGAMAHNKWGRDSMLDRVSDKLELTEVQKSELGSIFSEMRERRKALREEVTRQISDTVTAPQLSQQEALELLQLPHNQRQVMQEWVAGRLADFHTTLTQEQREEAAQVMVSFLHGRHGKHHRGGYGIFGFHHKGGHHDRYDDDDDDDDRHGYFFDSK